MSLAIDIDNITGVLLADGWHGVDEIMDMVWVDNAGGGFKQKRGKVSAFTMDSYEFIDADLWRMRIDQGRDGQEAVYLAGGQDECVGIPAKGFSFVENGVRISGPVTSILAVRERK